MKDSDSDVKNDRTSDGFLRPLLILALIATLAGALGSAVLTFRAGTSTQPLLRILFVLWVLAPFVVQIWAHRVSIRWSVLSRTTLAIMMLLTTLISLAAYASLIQPPAGSAHAFLFVVVPPLSILLLAVPVAAAAWISRGRTM